MKRRFMSKTHVRHVRHASILLLLRLLVARVEREHRHVLLLAHKLIRTCAIRRIRHLARVASASPHLRLGGTEIENNSRSISIDFKNSLARYGAVLGTSQKFT